MATIAELRLPADEFVLSHVLTTIEDVAFEIERFVAHAPDEVFPYTWALNVDADDLEPALQEDPTVEVIEQVTDAGDGILYQLKWVDPVETLVQVLVEEDGTILAAEGNQDRWLLRTLFPDRDALSRTYDWCRENGLSLEIQRIYDVSDGRQGRFGLTEEQEEVITAAYEQGYYRVPRDIPLTDLAEELGISHQALSEQLRRGHQTLVENSLLVGYDDNENEVRE